MSLQNHSVQFYNDDIFLTQSVARFITEGLEANETVIIVLSKFMVAEWPSELRFRQVVDGMLGQARQSGPVRIFGEMVAVLWARGYTWAALRLEALWNKLLEEHSFALLCAYPMPNLSTDQKSLQAISRLHTHMHIQ